MGIGISSELHTVHGGHGQKYGVFFCLILDFLAPRSYTSHLKGSRIEERLFEQQQQPGRQVNSPQVAEPYHVSQNVKI
jgi:hypothetical protein